MIELPDFSPLRATSSTSRPLKAALDRFDHALVVIPSARHSAIARLPHGLKLQSLLVRAKRNGDDFASTRLGNARTTGITIGTFDAAQAFAALTWSAKALRECLRDKPRALGIVLAGFDESTERNVAEKRARGRECRGLHAS
jgi:hypothetical protein